MLTGFKEFLMRGNLIELAVAFVMAEAFGTVVKATVTVVMDIVGKAGGTPDFSSFAPGGVQSAPCSRRSSASSCSRPSSTSSS